MYNKNIKNLLLLFLLSMLMVACGGGTQGSSGSGTPSTSSSGDDPLYQFQWHLRNNGQTAFAEQAGSIGADLNMTQAMQDRLTGKNVHVAIIDTGLEIAHEDLAANIEANASCDFSGYSYSANCQDRDPTSTSTTGDHGTSVAGITGAVGSNAVGGKGVAPDVRLRGFNVLAGNQYNGYYVNSLGTSIGGDNNSGDVDIFNQSYSMSPADDMRISSTDAIDAAYWYGVNNLRNGKGALYVKSAGNGFVNNNTNCSSANHHGVSCGNANMEPYNAQPYNIVVAAINADDNVSSYSTWGSNIWISGYGGESGYNAIYHNLNVNFNSPSDKPAMVTTDQSGCDKGYSQRSVNLIKYGGGAAAKVTPFHDTATIEGRTYNKDCNYTSTFNGTSSAAPVISGVIALLLEANPSLTWRDVKHILASTATQIDTNKAAITMSVNGSKYTLEDGWITNAASFTFHNAYGFGKANVDAAVAMATNNYISLSDLITSSWAENTADVAIPDNSSAGATSTIIINNGNNNNINIVESVQIDIEIEHGWTMDLGIELISPNGTRSVMLHARNGFGHTDDLDMQLLSNAFYGESVNGTWTLKVVDTGSFLAGTIKNWRIRFFGRSDI